MKASIAWLNEYVDLKDLNPEDIAHKLTMAGLEVEELYDRFHFLNNVVAAKVVSLAPHPSADKLKICQVDAGTHGFFQVVCGASNVEAGGLYPLALVGASMPGGQLIKKAELRGVPSEGMLCSAHELALDADAAGLLLLKDAEPGQSLKALTGRTDWCITVGITPNRPDALSMIGLARDLSAILGRPLTLPETPVLEEGPEIKGLAQVEIEVPEHCPRYVARVLQGVKIGPSPKWLQDYLAAVGIRSINNIVDVTNYVMMETGQPLHAFDLAHLAGQKIIVKSYESGQKFTTLDGQERNLNSVVNLMICDAEKAVALAGIMGGLNSEVTENTKDILLESAAFKATTVRRSSRSLGLSTEASYRYERGSDPEICAYAADRAIELMRSLGGGLVARGRLDNYPRPHQAVVVPFSPEKCNALLGTKHQTADMVNVLSAIGLKMSASGDGYTATLPSWRPDLFREVDVQEEVARLLNFDNLPATLPAPPTICRPAPAAWQLREQVRDFMISYGFAESITYSFIHAGFVEKLGLDDHDPAKNRLLPLLNPLTEDHGVLRPLLAPSLLNALRQNQYHQTWQVALFEVGNIFLSNGENKQPEERQTIAGIWSGPVAQVHFSQPERAVDFWDIKGLLEALGLYLNLPFTFAREDSLSPYYNAAEAAVIRLGGELLGQVGRLSDKAFKAFGLKDAGGPVYLFELNAEVILAQKDKVHAVKFQSWGRYPAVERDLALVLDKDVLAADILAAINKNTDWPIKNMFIFDLYQGNQLPPDKKSLALRFSFQAEEKTLTDDEVGVYFQEITALLNERFGASLRS